MMYNSMSKVQSTGYMRNRARVSTLELLHIMIPFLTSQHWRMQSEARFSSLFWIAKWLPLYRARKSRVGEERMI
jgi:hypothetical protein